MPKWCDIELYNKDSGGIDSAEDMLEMAEFLGYRLVSFAGFREWSPIFLEYKTLASSYGLDYVSRIDIIGTTVSEIKFYLKKYRKKVELIVAHPRNIQTARFCARDRRIDAIHFNYEYEFYDITQLKLMYHNEKFIELSIRPLLKSFYGKDFKKTLMAYVSIAKLIRITNVSLIMTSGATRKKEMKDPRSILSLWRLLTNKNFINYMPYRIYVERIINRIEQNREKLSGRYILPGVHLADSHEEN